MIYGKVIEPLRNLHNRRSNTYCFKKFGLTADAVDNGKKVLDALETKDYHIVLMDIQMPEMDGITATKLIRDPESKVKNHDVRIIAMTAHAMKRDREMCMKAGMNDFLAKPLNPKTFMEVIEKNIKSIP